MATKKISELTAVTTPAGTDVLAVVQGGETKRETVSQLVVAWSQVGSTPTTLSGYGIADAVTNGGDVATIQRITQAAYDLLAPPVATTLYVIVD